MLATAIVACREVLGAALIVSALLLAFTGTNAAGEPVSADAATIRDFMIQNVCVDDGGAVMPGRSPLDPSRLCPRQRDIEPADRLPYHKHDHPSPEHARDLPLGYQ